WRSGSLTTTAKTSGRSECSLTLWLSAATMATAPSDAPCTTGAVRSFFACPGARFGSAFPGAGFAFLRGALCAGALGAGPLRDGALAPAFAFALPAFAAGAFFFSAMLPLSLPDDHVSAAGAGHRALDDEGVLSRIDADDRQVLGRDPLVAHVPRRPQALEDPRGKGGGADAAGRAMEHRAVRRGA